MGVYFGPPCYGYAFILPFCLFGHTRDTSVIYEKEKIFYLNAAAKSEFTSVQISMKQVSYIKIKLIIFRNLYFVYVGT